MGTNSPAVTDPATAAYEYEIRFVHRDKRTTGLEADTDVGVGVVTIVTTSTDREQVKDRAYDRVQREHGFESREAVEDRYTIDRCGVQFHDEPWDDGSTLETTLDDLDGVQSLRYISPFEGSYGPPRYWLSVERGTEEAVMDAVTNYYPGLQVTEDDGGVVVTVSALANVD